MKKLLDYGVIYSTLKIMLIEKKSCKYYFLLHYVNKFNNFEYIFISERRAV